MTQENVEIVSRIYESLGNWMLDLHSASDQLDLHCEELIDGGEAVVSVLHVRTPPGQGRTGRLVREP